MAFRTTAHIVTGTVSVPSGIARPDALRSALVSGTWVERYGRRWHLGGVTEDAQRVLSGRVGFERTSGTTPLWDEAKRDFLIERVRLGYVSPYALQLANGRIAFQRRPGFIERQSFVGAFEALLREGSGIAGWSIELDEVEESFYEWVGRIDRLEELTIRVDRPNPNWHGRDAVKDFSEKFGVRSVTIAARAAEEDTEGVKTEDQLVQEAIDHVIATGSGRVVGRAARQGRRVRWDSRVEGEQGEATVEIDPETKEVSAQGLLAILRRRRRD